MFLEIQDEVLASRSFQKKIPPQKYLTEDIPITIFGLDLLQGKAWTDWKGRRWVFELVPAAVRLLQAAPFLPPSKITNVKPCILPSGAKERIYPVISDSGDVGIISPCQTPLLQVCVNLTGSGS